MCSSSFHWLTSVVRKKCFCSILTTCCLSSWISWFLILTSADGSPLWLKSPLFSNCYGLGESKHFLGDFLFRDSAFHLNENIVGIVTWLSNFFPLSRITLMSFSLKWNLQITNSQIIFSLLFPLLANNAFPLISCFIIFGKLEKSNSSFFIVLACVLLFHSGTK